MRVIQCEKGHFYDNDTFRECPHCKEISQMSEPAFPVRKTPEVKEPEIRTVLFSDDDIAPSGKTYGEEKWSSGEEETKNETSERKRGLIVGWLIGVTGSVYGEYYPLFTDDNWIGKTKEGKICVGAYGDFLSMVCCVISFDMQSKEFYYNDEIYVQEDKRQPVYVDGELITETIFLEDLVILEIEGLQFQLIKLCKDGFSWWKEKKKTGRTDLLRMDEVMKGTPQKKAKWICPVCGAENEMAHAYCLTCGRSKN